MATRKKTSSKSKITAAKAAPVEETPEVEEAVEATEPTLVNELRKKEFVERVAEASGQKKGISKKVIEAALRELGDALQRGEAINLPPLGKLTVNREKDVGGAHILIAKLRRSKAMLSADSASPEGESEDAPEAETADS